jgi:hypothetical protein
MRKNKEPRIRVNLCYQLNNEKKCVTLEKNDAYATRDWVEKNDGVVFWFSALDE